MVLWGKLSSAGILYGKLSSGGTLKGSATISRETVPEYEGNYQVIPSQQEQILPTKQRKLLDDVSILAIPYFETSNVEGGNTVYIGTDLEVNYGE